MGDASGHEAKNVIEARPGWLLSPGFIDDIAMMFRMLIRNLGKTTIALQFSDMELVERIFQSPYTCIGSDASMTEPIREPKGIKYVFVNGAMRLRHGEIIE